MVWSITASLTRYLGLTNNDVGRDRRATVMYPQGTHIREPSTEPLVQLQLRYPHSDALKGAINMLRVTQLHHTADNPAHEMCLCCRIFCVAVEKQVLT